MDIDYMMKYSSSGGCKSTHLLTHSLSLTHSSPTRPCLSFMSAAGLSKFIIHGRSSFFKHSQEDFSHFTPPPVAARKQSWASEISPEQLKSSQSLMINIFYQHKQTVTDSTRHSAAGKPSHKGDLLCGRATGAVHQCQ